MTVRALIWCEGKVLIDMRSDGHTTPLACCVGLVLLEQALAGSGVGSRAACHLQRSPAAGGDNPVVQLLAGRVGCDERTPLPTRLSQFLRRGTAWELKPDMLLDVCWSI